MPMKCVIGIDTGTTHFKTALIGADGQMLSLDKVETPLCTCGQESWYDPLQVYEIVKGQIQRMARKVSSRKDLEICGICLTGMAEAGLILQRNTGEELTEILPWFDKRPAEFAKRLKEEHNRSQYHKTGLYNSYKYGIYKYMWLIENKKLEKSTSIWLSLSDYIAFKLTGEYSTTAGVAVRTYAYDMMHENWDREQLDRYGLAIENFPSVRKEGESIGLCTDKELCEILGRHVAVAISGHDHVCALYAITGEDSTRIVDSCGTAETYMGITDKAPLTEEDYDQGIVLGPYPVGAKQFWMGNIPSSGQSVEWFRKGSGNQIKERVLTYEEMEAMLENRAGEPTGLFYFPFLSGVGTPVYRGDMKEQLHWKMEDVSAEISLKAIIEGIQYQGTWIMKCAGRRMIKDKMQLWCVGGAAKSREWMKIKADILGMPVYVPCMEEAALMGAAAIFFMEKEEAYFPGGVQKKKEENIQIYLPTKEGQVRYRVLAEEYRRRAKQICEIEE